MKISGMIKWGTFSLLTVLSISISSSVQSFQKTNLVTTNKGGGENWVNQPDKAISYIGRK